MARNLRTGWIKLATSGSVVDGKHDGRIVEKVWLTDMASNFNTKVYTPKIWPEHKRYNTGGNVVALKVEPATEPELEGEIHLFGILAPNNWLISANQEGYYTFPSIEVGENYLNKGGFFLEGLGVTDTPGSAGLTELKFSGKQLNLIPCSQVDLAQFVQSENKNIFQRAMNLLLESPDDDNPQDEKMNDEQFNKLIASVDAQTASNKELANKFTSLESTINTASSETTPPEDSTDDKNKDDESSDNKDKKNDFSKIESSVEKLTNTVATLSKAFSTALGEEVPGTNIDDSTGDADSTKYI